MANPQNTSTDKTIPLGQRLLDRPFLLLVLGMLVMVGFYTGWGILEIWLMPTAQLP
jgi:hypothetical protein